MKKFKINNSRGQMAMLATVFIVMVISPSSAFVVDLGVMQWQRSRAQRAVDSAVLASIKEYIKQSASDTDYTYATRAKGVAVSFASQNGSDVNANSIFMSSAYTYRAMGAKDSLTIKNGRYDVSTKVFTTGSTPLNAIEVSISRSVPLYFGRIFGLSKSTVAVTALARIGRAARGTYPGILPLGVPDAEYDPTSIYTMKGINFGSTAPGYKGILNLDKRWWHCAYYDSSDAKWYSLYDFDGDSDLVAQADYTGDGIYDNPACNGSDFSYLDIDNDGEMDYNDGDGSSESAMTNILDLAEDTTEQHRGVLVVDASSVPPDCSQPLTQDWKCYVSNGYNGGVQVTTNQRVDIVTGQNVGPFCTNMANYITNHGNKAIVPLIDDYMSQGTNTNIRIVRFAVFTVNTCDFSGPNPIYNGEFAQVVVNGDIDDSPDLSNSDEDIFAVKLAR